MNRNHLIALVLIAVSIGAIFSTLGDASTYVTFAEQKIPDRCTRSLVHSYEPGCITQRAKTSSLFTRWIRMECPGRYCMLSPNHRISSGQKK